MKEITKEQLAQELNGIGYCLLPPKEIEKKAKQNNQVIILGNGDDETLSICGTIDEIELCYLGIMDNSFHFPGDGDIALILPGEEFEADGENFKAKSPLFVPVEEEVNQPDKNRIVKVKWLTGAETGCSFFTNMPHSKFDIVDIDTDEPCGFGIVIDLDEIQ
jgi:hypothetical protein